MPQSKINNIGNSADSTHSISPGWVLTFVTFKEPAPIPPSENQSSETNNNLVVTSDCIGVTTSHSKSGFIHSMEATLLGGEINYLAALNAGDYVVVNMLDNVQDAVALAKKAKAGLPINSIDDGFKGVYKVTSVRKRLSVSGVGFKRTIFQIQAQAFTEFGNSIYFNPYLISSLESGAPDFYLANLSKSFQNKLGTKTDLQSIVSILMPLFLGAGPNLKNLNVKYTPSSSNQSSGSIKPKTATIQVSPNGYFSVTSALANLLNIPNAQSFNQFFRFLLGIQKYTPVVKNKYSKKTGKKIGTVTFTPEGYQPALKVSDNNYYTTPDPVSGTTVIRPEYFNQSTGWSIINSYCNAPINEMYTTFRLSPEGIVMPFFVFRQIPFSSNSFNQSTQFPVTPFTSLPLWELDPSVVLDVSIGRDDSARFNFVQVFGTPFGWAPEAQQRAIAEQNRKNSNHVQNTDDIKRSGLRPYVLQNSLDFPQFSKDNKTNFLSPFWTKLLGDALIGGQMKLSGTIRCFGVQNPIAIGDNLLFDNIIYHIEGIQHECSVSSDGQKSFYTTFSLSHGVDASSTNGYTVYGEEINNLYKNEINLQPDYKPVIVNDNPDNASQNQNKNIITNDNIFLGFRKPVV